MFSQLGDWLARRWFIVLGIWITVFVGLRIASPPFNEIARGGEFVFLPEDMASRQAELQFSRAFPGRRTTSSMVVVVHREEDGGLTNEDRNFITDKLTPALEDIRNRINGS